MEIQTFTVRAQSETLAQIDALGSATDRSRDTIVNAAIDRYLIEEDRFIQAVNEGQKDASSGQMSTHSEVFQKLRNRIHSKPQSA